MKTFVFSVLISITHVFSRSIHVSERDEIRNISEHETPVHLFSKRSDYFSLNNSMNDYPLGLMIMSVLPNDQQRCTSSLTDLCGSLSGVEANIRLVNAPMSDICQSNESISDFCGTLGSSNEQELGMLGRKCREIEKALKKIVGTSEGDHVNYKEKYRPPTVDECNKYTVICDTFGHRCHHIRDLCSRFASMCYQKQQEAISDSLITTILKGSLGSTDECVSTLHRKCKCILGLGFGLTSCIKPRETCDKLVSGLEKTCSNLKDYLQELVSQYSDDSNDSDDSDDSDDLDYSKRLKKRGATYEQRLLEKECDMLHKMCHDYSRNCGDPNITDLCKKRETICGTGLSAALKQKTRVCDDLISPAYLSNVYMDALESGVMTVIKFPSFDLLLMLLLDMFHQPGNTLEQQCQTLFGSGCSYFEYSVFASIKNDCNRKWSDKCKGLDARVGQECKSLKKALLKLEFLGKDNWPTYFGSTDTAGSHISPHQCHKLLSQCYYLGSGCGPDVKKLCGNLKTLCSWSSRKIFLLTQFWGELRSVSFKNSGNLEYSEFSQSLKEVQNFYTFISKVCKELIGVNPYFMLMCLYPTFIFSWVGYTISHSSGDLNKGLESAGSSPSLQECWYYSYLCGLFGTSADLKEKCKHFKTVCFKSDSS